MTENPAQPIDTTDSAATKTLGLVSAGPAGFDLLDEVGRGGMGVVWRARDTALDREVAVKLLLDTYTPGSSAARRFLDEARITGQL
jgi:serine/threonine protein kinase